MAYIAGKDNEFKVMKNQVAMNNGNIIYHEIRMVICPECKNDFEVNKLDKILTGIDEITKQPIRKANCPLCKKVISV